MKNTFQPPREHAQRTLRRSAFHKPTRAARAVSAAGLVTLLVCGVGVGSAQALTPPAPEHPVATVLLDDTTTEVEAPSTDATPVT